MFKIISDKIPRGDQPKAISEIVKRLNKKERDITLLGATGTGKTFTIANVIEKVKRPTLIMSPNKTLAAQLYQELKELFPENSVHYFISYYDYYQPEAYVPKTDTYIAKEADVNSEIDQLRLAATSALLDREDVIIVASVSCIYNLGSPDEYRNKIIPLNIGQKLDRKQFFRDLVDIQYKRNQHNFDRGMFRVQGDVIDIFLSYEKFALRVELWDDEIESLSFFNPISGETIEKIKSVVVYPSKHFLLEGEKLSKAIQVIREELDERERELVREKNFVAAERLKQRTNYDIEMMQEIGYCSGIENYSRHLLGRAPGSRPFTLIDYFPKDFLLIVDESHVTIPQIGGMFNGDYSRKKTLIDFGFRLPSALDNRPLKFEEFDKLRGQTVYLSATPGKFELNKSNGVVEQIIRPTGLVDPEVEVRPTKNQMQDLKIEIDKQIKNGNRILVTTLTKRLAEDITDYLNSENIKTRYLHSDIDALERTEIIRELRLGHFDVLVGINLLREGLDIPEVGLIGILDADKEGFLRSTTSLIQTIGRAARNSNGKVIMYGDRITKSMRNAIDETDRRREIQLTHNKKHKIIPQTIQKTIHDKVRVIKEIEEDELDMDRHDLIVKLESQMRKSAEMLDFETAAKLRDKLKRLSKEVEAVE